MMGRNYLLRFDIPACAGYFLSMDAKNLIRRKTLLYPDVFIEFPIWQVPEPLPPRAHDSNIGWPLW
jgi:hypothetical protein